MLGSGKLRKIDESVFFLAILVNLVILVSLVILVTLGNLMNLVNLGILNGIKRNVKKEPKFCSQNLQSNKNSEIRMKQTGN